MSTVASPSPILDAAGVAPDEALSILQTALSGADDGELFLERSESEALVFDDGRLKTASYDSGEGFGLRVVAGVGGYDKLIVGRISETTEFFGIIQIAVGSCCSDNSMGRIFTGYDFNLCQGEIFAL